jgi:cytochrome c oxidase assembly protein subunit 15
MTPQPLVSPGRRALGLFNAGAAFLLLVAGGLVTSTNSGMAVPDWPLSYGTWLPKMTGGVIFEHGHRMIASFVGLLILIMAFWTQFDERRPGVRRLAWWTLGLVILQGVFGGVTVYYNLPYQVSAAHATLGQTVFCLVLVMAELVGPGAGTPAGSAAAPALKYLGVFAVLSLVCQLAMGAVMRHGGSGIAPHLLGAAVAAPVAGAFAAAALMRTESSIQRPAVFLLVVLGVQLALGLATADFRSVPDPRADLGMIAVATTHLACGAVLLGTTVLLTFRLFRLGRATSPV